MRVRRACRIAGMAALVALGASPDEALAQRATGDYGKPTYAGRAAGRRISHARDYARGVRHYATRAPQVIADYGKQDAEEVARNIEGAKKDLAEVKKAHASDKEILARIEAIEKHLAAATAHQKEMHAACCEASPDADMVAGCCKRCLAELGKAKTEHDALMKKIDPTGASSDAPKKKKAEDGQE